MLPADQGFARSIRVSRASLIERDLRLIKKPQLAALERLAQPAFSLLLPLRLLRHLRRKKLVAGTRVAPNTGQHHFGVMQDGFGFGAADGGVSDTDPAPRPDFVALNDQRMLDLAQDPLGVFCRLRRADPPGAHDAELLPPPP